MRARIAPANLQYKTKQKLSRIMIIINTKNHHGIFIIESILLALNKKGILDEKGLLRFVPYRYTKI